jgi:hypothetical protein
MKKYVVIFVEGETDEEFFKKLLAYYKETSTKELCACKVVNVRGIGRYESKAIAKLKREIKPKIEKDGDILNAVCCSYDTDAFEFAEKPPVDWRKIKAEVKKMGIPYFTEIKARLMVEDWFLKDVDGLCSFLKIERPKNLTGNSGLDKIKTLFKRGNKIYQKGRYSNKFLEHTNIALIRSEIANELKDLEKLLNYK